MVTLLALVLLGPFSSAPHQGFSLAGQGSEWPDSSEGNAKQKWMNMAKESLLPLSFLGVKLLSFDGVMLFADIFCACDTVVYWV